MPLENDSSRFLQAAQCLGPRLYGYVAASADRLGAQAQEIRLRVNRPLAVVCTQGVYFFTLGGGITNVPVEGSALIVSRADVSGVFHNICNYSVYSRQNEIIGGFVTLRGGHRAGISGTAVLSGGQITNIRDISSINLRIAREHRGCAAELDRRIGNPQGGLLICGAPCSGKTTVLRDYAGLLSTKRLLNVALIDERGELAGTTSGEYQNDIGFCDVYDGYIKSEGMTHALRSMSPNVIVCDEIGSDSDISAIERCINCGVGIVATAHAANPSELRLRRGIVRLIAENAFENIVFLRGRSKPGEISSVIRAGDIIAA